ncbi:MAG: hypothetical protein IPJ88_15585 [Myxococcales bacterium]|nr:MAG: hypothetical protein IPJ88_15585 [Myxococcales bacterium]
MKRNRREFIGDGAVLLGLGSGLLSLSACDDASSSSDAGSDTSSDPDSNTSQDSSADVATDGLTPTDSGLTNNNAICGVDESLSVGVETVVHSHFLLITESDLENGALGPYSLTGSGHMHTVTFTSGEIATLRLNGTLTKSSTTTNAHAHDVTLQCVPTVGPPTE